MQPIVLYGPPLAGKATMLQAFATARSLPLRQFDPLAHVSAEAAAIGLRVPGRQVQTDRGLYVPGATPRFDLVTIWGVHLNTESWSTLLSKAAAIVLVLDPQTSREQTDRECIAATETLARDGLKGCVVWTKQDLVAQHVATVSKSVLADTAVANWPVFAARFDQTRTLLEPIDWLLRVMEED